MRKSYLSGENGGYVTQYLAGLTASIALFNAGLHFGWTVPSLPKIIDENGHYQMTTTEASYIAIIGFMGHVIGGLSGSILIDKIGRKNAILCIPIAQLLGFVLIFASYWNKHLLYLARISGGIGEGASLSIIPTYMSEVAAPEIRGTLGALIGIPFPIGAVFITLIGSYVHIRTMAMVCFIFPILLWSTFFFMPESPYYLLMHSRCADASKALMMLRRTRDIEKELIHLSADVNRQMSERGSYKDLFTISSNRSAFILVSLVRIFQQFTGVSAFMAYYQILIKQATSLSPVMGSVALLVIQIVMNWISYFFVDKLGRKVIMLTSAVLTMLVLLAMALFFTLKDYLGVDMTGLCWVPLTLMAIFVTTFSLGLGVVAAIFISEIYSTSIKSKALGLGSIVFAASMMSSTKLYQYFSDHFSMAVPFYAFGIATLFNVLFTYFFIPETKGKTLEQIQQELKQRKGWF